MGLAISAKAGKHCWAASLTGLGSSMVLAGRDRKALDDVIQRVDWVVNEHPSWGIICLKLKIKNWLLMN